MFKQKIKFTYDEIRVAENLLLTLTTRTLTHICITEKSIGKSIASIRNENNLGIHAPASNRKKSSA